MPYAPLETFRIGHRRLAAAGNDEGLQTFGPHHGPQTAASGGAAANFVNGIAHLIAPLGISYYVGVDGISLWMRLASGAKSINPIEPSE